MSDRNYALEYRMDKMRWDQARESVREMMDRQNSKSRGAAKRAKRGDNAE